jgi:cell division protein FtsB
MVSHFLQKPKLVLLACLILFLASVFVQGTLVQSVRLSMDKKKLSKQIEDNQKQIAILSEKIIEAKDPAFIHKQAVEDLDMVSENDLVFVFSE